MRAGGGSLGHRLRRHADRHVPDDRPDAGPDVRPVSGTVNHQVGKKHTALAARHLPRRRTVKNEGVGGTTLPEAASHSSDHEGEIIYTQRTILSPKLINQVRFLYGAGPGADRQRHPRAEDRRPGRVHRRRGAGRQPGDGAPLHPERIADLVGRHAPREGRPAHPRLELAPLHRPQQLRRARSRSPASTTTPPAKPYMFSQQQGDPDAEPRADAALALYAQDEISVRRNLAVTVGVPLRLAELLRGQQQPGSAPVVRVGPGQEGRDRGARRRRPLQRPAERRNDGRRDQVARRAGVPLRPPGSRLPDPTGSGSSIDDQPTSLVQLRCLRSSSRTRSSSALGIDRQVWKGDDPVGQLHRVARVPPDALARHQRAAAAALRRAARSGPRRRSGRSSRRPASESRSLQVVLRGKLLGPRFSGSVQYGLGRAFNDTNGIGSYPANNYDLTGGVGPRRAPTSGTASTWSGRSTRGAGSRMGVAFSARSGRPYTMRIGRDVYNNGTTNARPPGVSAQQPAGHRLGQPGPAVVARVRPDQGGGRGRRREDQPSASTPSTS